MVYRHAMIRMHLYTGYRGWMGCGPITSASASTPVIIMKGGVVVEFNIDSDVADGMVAMPPTKPLASPIVTSVTFH